MLVLTGIPGVGVGVGVGVGLGVRLGVGVGVGVGVGLGVGVGVGVGKSRVDTIERIIVPVTRFGVTTQNNTATKRKTRRCKTSVMAMRREGNNREGKRNEIGYATRVLMELEKNNNKTDYLYV